MKSISIVAAALVLAAGSAGAANLVQNGGFDSASYASNSQFGAGFGGEGVTSWMGGGGNHLQFFYIGGTQSTTNAVNQFGDPKGYFYDSFSTLSPTTGGNFVALDGDSDFTGFIQQDISGLVVGQTYSLSFDWAAAQLKNRIGPITEQLQVSLGSDTFLTSIAAISGNVSADIDPTGGPGGFGGWMTTTHSFTATATTETLKFLSVGTPNGLPPIAALDSIALTSVPEPAAWMMMLLGFGGLGAVLRRRRAVAA
jgi:hypothetical protein